MTIEHSPQSLSQDTGPWHLAAVRLPDGTAPEEWWIVDGKASDAPVPGARDLPGGWFLPGGLVDAHVHLTMNFNAFALRDGSADLIAANMAAQRAAGVLTLRDAGLAWGGRPEQDHANGPRLQSAGRLLAPPGRGYPQICHWVEADRLVEVALEELKRGGTWVKIMGDFPGPDGDWFAAPPNYPRDVLHALVQAVHAAGGRVMAHSTGQAVADLVAARVDSIEHGMQLNGELLETMAQNGIAWTLTMATALKHVGALATLDNPIGAMILSQLARVRELLPLAVSLGVPLLAGTDELPHGAIAQELAVLYEFGLSPRDAIAAASTAARAWLGLPDVTVGTAADLVTFPADPRANLAVLAHPAAVVFNGRRIR
jgi:imidazolonepropionase-like amidohydrolase